MKIDSREDLTQYFQRRYRWVRVPSARSWFGDLCRLQSLTEKEMAAFLEPAMMTGQGAPDVEKIEAARRLLVACCWVDSEGQMLFDPSDEQDLAAIGRLDGRVIERLYRAARDLCGYSEPDILTLVASQDIQNVIAVLPLLTQVSSERASATPELRGAATHFRQFQKQWNGS